MKYNSCKVCNSLLIIENEKYNLVKCENCKLIFSKKKFTKIDFKKTIKLLE